jgi:segregation and condensation protein B
MPEDTSPEPPSYDALKRIIESVLYVADKPVEIGFLARITGADARWVDEIVTTLASEYQTRGIRIQRNGDSIQTVTAPESAPFIQAFLGIDENQRLTHGAIVALTVIAYKQPITRPALEKVLGKNCDWHVASLKARELITEVGRANAPGRPYLYGTTFRFLEHFGLERPEDLPPLPELEVIQATETGVAQEDTEPVSDEGGTSAEPALEAEAAEGESELEPATAVSGEDQPDQ